MICNDSQIWQSICLAAGIFDEPGNESLLERNESLSVNKWKQAYVEYHLRSLNWAKAFYMRRAIDVFEPSTGIISMRLGHDKMVVGSRSKLCIYSSIGSTEFLSSDRKRPQPTMTIEEPQSIIMSLDISIDGLIVSGDSNGKLVLWNSFTGECLAYLKDAHHGGVTSVLLINRDQILSCGTPTDGIQVTPFWDSARLRRTMERRRLNVE